MAPPNATVLEPPEVLRAVHSRSSWPSAVALHGDGYAVDAVGNLPWVRQARVVYWGDLDSHGFAILHRLRAHLPTVVSVLMDEQTLLDHRDLWVPDPKPTRAQLPSLTASEHTAWERLRAEGNVRLEQERIPWERSLEHLRAAAEFS